MEWFFKLVTKGRVKVIKSLMDYPNRTWITDELARHSHASTATTWRLINDLEKYGIVKRATLGKTKVFSLVKQNPYLSSIREFLKSEASPVMNSCRRMCSELGKRYSFVEKCKLFGSYARGTAKPESDVDIFVLVKNADEAKKRKIERFFDEKSRQAGKTINPDMMDVLQFRELVQEKDAFAKNIEEEGMTLFEKRRKK